MALVERIEQNFVRTEVLIKNFGLAIASMFLPEILFSAKTLGLTKLDKNALLDYVLLSMAVIIIIYLSIKAINSLYKRIQAKKNDSDIEVMLEKKKIIEDQFATHEVDTINAFGNEVIGGNHLPDSNIIEQRRKKSPNVIKTVSIINGRAKELVGYYVLYPLTEKITQDILVGDVLNAKQLQLCDITSSFTEASSIYVGMLLGSNRMSKAAIEKILVRDIRNYLELNSGIKYVFAKPASNDGNRITTQNGFVPIDNSEIKYIEIKQ